MYLKWIFHSPFKYEHIDKEQFIIDHSNIIIPSLFQSKNKYKLEAKRFF